MSRYIDADVAWAIIKRAMPLNQRENLAKAFEQIPSADVKEVVRGEWVERDEYYDDIVYRCSACRTDFCLYEGTPQENEWNFCPNCGADMRGKSTKVETNIFDEEEIHENCTVQILKNSQTGEISVGWWEND